jgi:2-methylcitrate dehydratase PrpD
VFLSDLVEQLEAVPPTIPADVRDQAGMCLVDALACAYGGREMPWTVQAREVVGVGAGGGGTIWGSGGRRAGLADAAFANAVACHSLLHEDTHIESRVHPGTVVVPAVLAVGEFIGASMSEVLQATIVGYEAIAQVAATTLTDDFVDRGWRASSVFGPFGAAAAAAHLLRLDRTRTVHALGLAASSSAGICQWAEAGSVEAFFQNANACRAGLVSALLARAGVTGADSAIEGRFGLRAAFGGTRSSVAKPEIRTDRMAVAATFFKAYPSCALTQESIDAALQIAGRGIDTEAVTAVTIHTSAAAARYPGCDNASDLATTISRQMSLQFAVAAALTDGALRPSRYSGSLDPGLARLASRIEVVVDPAADRAYPARRDARVEVRLTDDRTVSATSRDEVSLTAPAVIAKFHDYAGPVLGPSAATAVVDMVRQPESCPDVARLVADLR